MYQYDGLDRLVSVTEASQLAAEYTYDASGARARTIDRKHPVARTRHMLTADFEWDATRGTVEMAPTKIAPIRRVVSVVYSGTKDELVERTRGLLDIVAHFIGAEPDDHARTRVHGVVRASAIEDAGGSATR